MPNKENPIIARVNLAQKAPNTEFKLSLTQIPFGLYNLVLLHSNGDGLEKDITIEKYDSGKTTSTIFEGNIVASCDTPCDVRHRGPD